MMKLFNRIANANYSIDQPISPMDVIL